ncbi:MAG: cadmium-transporting ATPase, partial [Ilumatobacter fluminis]
MGDACCGGAQVADERASTDDRSRFAHWQWWAAALAAASWLIGITAELSDLSISRPLFVVAIIAGGSTFVPGAVRAVVGGRRGVDVLMTIALGGALAREPWGEAASRAFL